VLTFFLLPATDWLYFDRSVGAKIWRHCEAILFTGIVYPSVGSESRLRTVVCVVRLACLAI